MHKVMVLGLIVCWYGMGTGWLVVDRCVAYGAYPLYRLTMVITEYATQWRDQWRTRDELKRALGEAEQEITQLRATIVALHAQQQYANMIAPLYRFCSRYAYDTALIVQVMSRCCSPDEQSIIVDAGSNQGVREDMIAIYGNGIVGRVTEVFAWYSRITLVTDKRCKIPVLCATTHTDGIYEGANSVREGRLLFVSCLDQLKPRDLVLTSGKGMIYPAGFAVGTVDTITHDAQGLYYRATITPYCDVFTITHCALLSKEQCVTTISCSDTGYAKAVDRIDEVSAPSC